MSGFKGMFLSAPDAQILNLGVLRSMTFVANMGVLYAVCTQAADLFLPCLFFLKPTDRSAKIIIRNHSSSFHRQVEFGLYIAKRLGRPFQFRIQGLQLKRILERNN